MKDIHLAGLPKHRYSRAESTAVDLDAVVAAGNFISRELGKPNGSKVGRALLAKAA